MQAMRDLGGRCNADGECAARFLFGADELASGWLGMLGITPSNARRRVVAHFERERHKPDPIPKKGTKPKQVASMLATAKRERKEAFLALQRIRAQAVGRD